MPASANGVMPPSIVAGQWIRISTAINAYVLRINGPAELEVGYISNAGKAIGEPVVWSGQKWDFKYPGPGGTYLRGFDEAAVMAGPPPGAKQ